MHSAPRERAPHACGTLGRSSSSRRRRRHSRRAERGVRVHLRALGAARTAAACLRRVGRSSKPRCGRRQSKVAERTAEARRLLTLAVRRTPPLSTGNSRGRRSGVAADRPHHPVARCPKFGISRSPVSPVRYCRDISLWARKSANSFVCPHRIDESTETIGEASSIWSERATSGDRSVALPMCPSNH